MTHKGRCVKFLYRELNVPKEALILGCVFEGTEPSISRGFNSQAPQKIRRYDDKKVSYLPLINLVPSPTRGEGKKALAAQLPSCSAAEPTTTRPRTSLRSNDGDLLLKEVNRHTSIPLSLHTSEPRRCA